MKFFLRKLIFMWEKVMRFDVHVASTVSEGSQHIGDKFYIVPGVVVDKKILHDLWWVDGWV